MHEVFAITSNHTNKFCTSIGTERPRCISGMSSAAGSPTLQYNQPNVFWSSTQRHASMSFYDTSKQSERKRCIEARVVSTHEHFGKCCRNNSGPPMTVALEHVHIAPQNELARQLLDPSLEDLSEERSTTQLCVSPPLELEDTNLDSDRGFLDTYDDDIDMERLRPTGRVTTMPATSFLYEITPVGNPERYIG